MENTLKGVLIEYGSDFLGPIPNVVVFQFNPEKLARTIEVPQRPVQLVFGGPDHRTLFIAARDSLYSARVK